MGQDKADAKNNKKQRHETEQEEKRAFYIARGAFMHQKADAEPKAEETTNKRVKKPPPPEEDDPRGQVGTFLRQPRRR